MSEFDEVYGKYFYDVYKYILGLSRNEAIAEEITQETFFKALQGIDRFDGKCKIYVWLCQIAKNTYYTYLKKQSRFDTETAAEDFSDDDFIEQKMLKKESAFEIYKVLHDLEEPYKEVFSLRTFGELPFAQIAELFGKTESWARVTYHRAKLKIKEKIK